jgi:hypothetical protein
MSDEDVEIRFHTSKLPYVPRSYAHLSGLADFFSSKVKTEEIHFFFSILLFHPSFPFNNPPTKKKKKKKA